MYNLNASITYYQPISFANIQSMILLDIQNIFEQDQDDLQVIQLLQKDASNTSFLITSIIPADF